ncbi:hypothetical protein AC1031_021908 [Aphanomyces cochlioides]|nr:hypothetical protein AC1031_021908 [Aphanomyces cochlioides]
MFGLSRLTCDPQNGRSRIVRLRIDDRLMVYHSVHAHVLRESVLRLDMLPRQQVCVLLHCISSPEFAPVDRICRGVLVDMDRRQWNNDRRRHTSIAVYAVPRRHHCRRRIRRARNDKNRRQSTTGVMRSCIGFASEII